MTSECCQEYIVQDAHTGDEICTACSRATRALFTSYSAAATLPDRPCHFSFIEQELRDICANYCIPDNIFYQTVERLRKNPLGRQREQQRETAASCLHRVLAEHDAPRTLKELSVMFHIPESHIRQPQRQQQQMQQGESSTSLTKPSDLARRVLYSFDIIHQPMVNKIGKEGDVLFYGSLCSSTPQSALAVSIALNLPFVPKQLVASHCHISKQTLLKHLRRLGLGGK